LHGFSPRPNKPKDKTTGQNYRETDWLKTKRPYMKARQKGCIREMSQAPSFNILKMMPPLLMRRKKM
jgi:hypothetical protein